MEKKIGLVTWHYYSNFGSLLQAYALQTILIDLGYSSEFINYRKIKFKSSKLKTAIKYFASYLSIILPKQYREMYSFRFIKFQYDFLKQSKRTYSAETLKKYNSKYDIFICGSDQIWAPNVFDPVYLLSFVDDNKPKISYAPSIGLDSIPISLHDIYRELLNRFDSLSVREEKGAEILKTLFEINAEIVLDPTLLKKEIWEEIVIKPKINDEYIFCYFLGKNKSHREIVKKIAKKLNYKIITISNFLTDDDLSDYIDKFAGPREFLGYVNNAKLIFTDSFHGAAFSINFNKQFYVFERFSIDDQICQNSRIYNLLAKVGLQNRIIKYNQSFEETEDIEFANVNLLLSKEKEKSMDYLKNSLKKW